MNTTEAINGDITPQQRRDLLADQIALMTAHGWRVESAQEASATLVKGHRANHLLHVILSVLTLGLWVPVWIIVAILSGEKRRTVRITPQGVVVGANG